MSDQRRLLSRVSADLLTAADLAIERSFCPCDAIWAATQNQPRYAAAWNVAAAHLNVRSLVDWHANGRTPVETAAALRGAALACKGE